MKYKIPVLRNCCLWIPLSSGLLAYGYLKLIMDFTLLVLSSITLFKYKESLYLFLIVLGLIITDFVMTAVFIIGCHFRKETFLMWYFYYSIYTLALTTVFIIVLFKPILLLPYILNLTWHTYLLLLIKSKIYLIKSDYNVISRYVNNSTDQLSTIKIEEENNPRKDKKEEIIDTSGTYETSNKLTSNGEDKSL